MKELALALRLVRERHVDYHGRRLHVLPHTGSTMDNARDLIGKGGVDGTTVIALAQGAGKGSSGRAWQSPPGNLYLSRLVAVRAGEWGQEMELIAACAVAEIMREMLPRRDIANKYPNDVLVEGQKICGCLVYPCDDSENGPRLAVLGVGVNLAVAPQIPGRATTSLLAHGVDADIAVMAARFEAKFAAILGAYRLVGNFDSVLKRLGFLDAAGEMTLHANEGGAATRGAYAGFEIRGAGKEAKAFLRLRRGGEITALAVHGHHITGAPPRPAAAPKHFGESAPGYA